MVGFGDGLIGSINGEGEGAAAVGYVGAVAHFQGGVEGFVFERRAGALAERELGWERGGHGCGSGY